eukprot:2516109-Amphidinium_carterae.1
MLDIASLASLQVYERCLERLCRLWPSCWHFVALADDKARAEQLERVRRRTLAGIDGGDPTTPDFSRAAPW